MELNISGCIVHLPINDKLNMHKIRHYNLNKINYMTYVHQCTIISETQGHRENMLNLKMGPGYKVMIGTMYKVFRRKRNQRGGVGLLPP